MGENTTIPKLSKSVLNIPGTRPNLQNGQLLISSGIPSFDEVIGGGLPIGTLILIEEDLQATYAKILLKYFLAEGIANNHSVFIASQDVTSTGIINELPSVIESENETNQNLSKDEKMVIAFRYQNVATGDTQKLAQFAHNYDLTKVIAKEVLSKADITHWKIPEAKKSSAFLNSSYLHLLKSIQNRIIEGQFRVTDKPEKRSVLRIGINSLGSPLWFLDSSTEQEIKQNKDVTKFFYCLRAVLRSSFAIGVVTVPAHLLNKNCLDRCIHSSDIVIRLQAFSGTELESNAVLSNYHGYFQLVKFAAINSFISKHPGSVEYTFRLRRKKFLIEKLHLPPDLEESGKNEVPSMGCGSSNKHLLEF